MYFRLFSTQIDPVQAKAGADRERRVNSDTHIVDGWNGPTEIQPGSRVSNALRSSSSSRRKKERERK